MARKRVMETPLDTAADADSKARMLCDLGQIQIICRIAPSLLTCAIEYSTHAVEGTSHVLVSVRMPMAVWEAWSLGAVDFCEAMCQSIQASLAQNADVSDFAYQCSKAGLNPGGCFFITMQYNKPPPPPPPPSSDEAAALVQGE